MTTTVDIVNRALQGIGTRTTVTQLELTNQTSNEAIQANLVLTGVRDELLRMAPWNCGMFFANLVYITSAPGTPENLSPGFTTWRRGIPAPPWAYEYQYPVDCLKPCWIVPQYSTGFSGGIPITTAVTGGVASFWSGPPVRFKVGIDNFDTITHANITTPGSGYVNFDTITFPTTPIGSAPIGAPAKFLITGVDGFGGITSIEKIIDIIDGDSTGNYFAAPGSPVTGVTTDSGSGTGASFTITGHTLGDRRVILTNEEFAILAYVKQVTDPNVMDPQFLQAWVSALSGRLSFALAGDKQLANIKLTETNNMIIEARKADANEGLTINNVTPDWIRHRGIAYPLDFGWAPNQTFDWGPVFSMY